MGFRAERPLALPLRRAERLEIDIANRHQVAASGVLYFSRAYFFKIRTIAMMVFQFRVVAGAP